METVFYVYSGFDVFLSVGPLSVDLKVPGVCVIFLVKVLTELGVNPSGVSIGPPGVVPGPVAVAPAG